MICRHCHPRRHHCHRRRRRLIRRRYCGNVFGSWLDRVRRLDHVWKGWRVAVHSTKDHCLHYESNVKMEEEEEEVDYEYEYDFVPF